MKKKLWYKHYATSNFSTKCFFHIRRLRENYSWKNNVQVRSLFFPEKFPKLAISKEQWLGEANYKIYPGEEKAVKEILDGFDFKKLKKEYNQSIRKKKYYYQKDTSIEEAISDIIDRKIKEIAEFKNLFIADDTEEAPTFEGINFEFFWKFKNNSYGFLTQRNKKRLDISSEKKFYNSLRILSPGSKIEDGIYLSVALTKKLVPYIDFLLTYEMHLKSYDHRLKLIGEIIEQIIKKHGPISKNLHGEDGEFLMVLSEITQELPEKDKLNDEMVTTFWAGFDVGLVKADDQDKPLDSLTFEEKKAIFDYKEIYRKVRKYYRNLNLIDDEVVEYFEKKKGVIDDDDIEGLVPEDDEEQEVFDSNEVITEITNPAPVIDSDATETDSDVTEPDTAGTQ